MGLVIRATRVGSGTGDPLPESGSAASDTLLHPRASVLAWAHCTRASQQGSGGERLCEGTCSRDRRRPKVCLQKGHGCSQGRFCRYRLCSSGRKGRACPRCSAFLGQKIPAPHGVVLPNGLGGVKKIEAGISSWHSF